MDIDNISDFNGALEIGPYIWPGGYPLYFVTADGAALSFDSAIANADEIREAVESNDRSSGWRVVATEVNWEDANLYCDHSNKRIESAYAEEEEEEEGDTPVTADEYAATLARMLAYYGFISNPLGDAEVKSLHASGCSVEQAYSIASDVAAGFSFEQAVAAQ